MAVAEGVLFQGGDHDIAAGPPALFAINASNGVILNQISLGQKQLMQSGVSIVDDIIYIGMGKPSRIQICTTCTNARACNWQRTKMQLTLSLCACQQRTCYMM